MGFHHSIAVIDSHTEGEPTRVVLSGYPDLGRAPLSERLQRLRRDYDGFRSGIVCEPRGSDAVVGALLLESTEPGCTAAAIFFNDVGYLGMCGHGTIGLVTTLAHLGRIKPGAHKIETPVGVVSTCLHADGSVIVQNVPSRRYRANLALDVAGFGRFTGDIAWGGNWFFLVSDPSYELETRNCSELMAVTVAIRKALREQQITGENMQEIDHIELFGSPADPANSSRNFVLCPGNAFDRSPCGTGTSAKMACLYADGKLKAGEMWRQEGILGTIFEGSFVEGENGNILPSIRGKAWITADARLHFYDDDPFPQGIHF